MSNTRKGGALPDPEDGQVVIVSTNFAQKGKPDRSSPTLSFISPVSNATVTGVVPINVSAKDNVGITEFNLFIDGVKVANTTTYSWDTSSYAAGTHTITASARDAAGNQKVASIAVVINVVVVDPPDPPADSGFSMKTPPILDQGGEGSCVAFAVGYAARSIDYYYKTNATSYSNSVNVFSPEHLYNQVKFPGDCGVGTAMQTALDFIVNNGILPFSSMPYSSLNGCSLQPTEEQVAQALNYKIEGYHKMYTTDKALIRSMLVQNKAVIITIVADNSFINAKTGFIWKTYSGSGSLGHSVAIVGYDDTKNAYKIMNSWGTSWGDAGFGWIDYDFFPTRTGTYCYAIK